MRRRVIALGDANVDLITRLVPSRVAGADVTRPITEIHPGGSVANTAVCLSRLGIPVSFVGKAGDDAFGRFIRDDLEKESVDTRSLSFSRTHPTAAVLVFIDAAGERYITLWPERDAAHTQLQAKEIADDIFDDAGWLHFSGLSLRQEPLRSATLRAARLAHAHDVQVSLDLNMRLEFFGMTPADASVFREAVELSDILLGSASEEILPLARILAGEFAEEPGASRAGDHRREPSAAEVLDGCGSLSRGTRVVVARTGARGAVIVGPDGHFESPAFEAPVVDTTGSGDAWDGGFLAALAEGRSLTEAARWGNAAAATNISAVGARNVPDRADFEQILAAGVKTLPRARTDASQ